MSKIQVSLINEFAKEFFVINKTYLQYEIFGSTSILFVKLKSMHKSTEQNYVLNIGKSFIVTKHNMLN